MTLIPRRLTAPALLLAVLSGTAIGDEDEPEEPPLTNRPGSFTGGVGAFVLSARVEPGRVRVGRPVELTLRVEARGPVRRPPGRPELAALPAIERDFHIEAPRPDSRVAPDGRSWEFVYLLKPRRVDVRRVPSVEFSFYHPEAGRYQTTFFRSLPLEVLSAEEVAPAEVQGAAVVTHPAEVRQFTADGVLSVDRRREPPGAASLAVLGLVPPAVCAAWYLLWRRRYPDAARATSVKRSRAAQAALHALESRRTASDTAAYTVGVVTEYLRQRLDLPAAEPTPGDIARRLAVAGAPAELAGALTDFFRAGDAARFGPPHSRGADLTGEARRLILKVEAEPWHSSPPC